MDITSLSVKVKDQSQGINSAKAENCISRKLQFEKKGDTIAQSETVQHQSKTQQHNWIHMKAAAAAAALSQWWKTTKRQRLQKPLQLKTQKKRKEDD